MIASTLVNIFRGKGKPAKIADFLPRFDAPRHQSAEEMQRRLKLASGFIKPAGAR